MNFKKLSIYGVAFALAFAACSDDDSSVSSAEAADDTEIVDEDEADESSSSVKETSSSSVAKSSTSKSKSSSSVAKSSTSKSKSSSSVAKSSSSAEKSKSSSSVEKDEGKSSSSAEKAKSSSSAEKAKSSSSAEESQSSSSIAIDLAYLGIENLDKKGYAVEGNEMFICTKEENAPTNSYYSFLGTKKFNMTISVDVGGDFVFAASVKADMSNTKEELDALNESFDKIFANADTIYTNLSGDLTYGFRVENPDESFQKSVSEKLVSSCALAKKNGEGKNYCRMRNIVAENGYSIDFTNGSTKQRYTLSLEDGEVRVMTGVMPSSEEFDAVCEDLMKNKRENQNIECSLGFIFVNTYLDITEEEYPAKVKDFADACAEVVETNSVEKITKMLDGLPE